MGHVSETGLHINSVIKLMRSALESASVEDPGSYSSHSLRRGFATAWNEAGGDLASLMAWVGWKNPATALKYQSPKRSPPSLLMQHWLQDESVQRQLFCSTLVSEGQPNLSDSDTDRLPAVGYAGLNIDT